MIYTEFIKQCKEYLPKKGCKRVRCDAFLSMNGITYKCTFEYKKKFHTLTCTHFNIWRLRCEDDLVSVTGHTDIAVCCDKYFNQNTSTQEV